jgi:DEAD/DEAH box helicase domain-containing protein
MLVSDIRSRALLPDMIKFSYIPKTELCIHGDPHAGFREAPVDFSVSSGSSTVPRLNPTGEDDEHVLVLDFADNSRGKKQQSDR